MHSIVCPTCGRRSLDEFTFGGERRAVPDWISVGENRISVTTDAGRFNYSRSKAETFRYLLHPQLQNGVPVRHRQHVGIADVHLVLAASPFAL